jgi:HYR domain/Right handed beta helix region
MTQESRVRAGIYVCVLALLAPMPVRAEIVFVNVSADGANDGSSWQDAFTNLHDGLLAAGQSDEVWVAEGTYVPTRDVFGEPTSGFDATFALYPGIRVFGGFAGWESQRHERDVSKHPVVLDGQDSRYHVVSVVRSKFGCDGSRLDGFTITGGNAIGVGSEAQGGGVWIDFCTPEIINCRLVRNYAAESGGGAHSESGGAFVNCEFIQNTVGTGGRGGGLSCGSAAAVMNTLISDNVVAEDGKGGGAFFAADPNAPTFLFGVSCVKNSVLGPFGRGGGIAFGGEAQAGSSILWNNDAAVFQQVYFASSPPEIDHSAVEDGWPGVGNISADPLFADSGAGNFRLSAASPCVDAGSPLPPRDSVDLDGDGDVIEPLSLDLDRTPRQVGRANMGSYEAFDCDLNGVGDYADIASGEAADCDLNGVPDLCDIAACEGDPSCADCNDNGKLDTCEGAGQRIYVDRNAEAGNDGSSWWNAYSNLSDAICIAETRAYNGPVEIWVARGTYRPRPHQRSGRTSGFRIGENVAVYGGFAGGETSLTQRNPRANVTILSADIFGNDQPGFLGYEENAVQVVLIPHGNAATIVDGVTLVGGNANDASFQEHLNGGGVRLGSGQATLRNCILVANKATVAGGAVYAGAFTSLTISACVFAGNRAEVAGGAIALSGASAEIVNSVFSANRLLGSGIGAAIAVRNGNVNVLGCTVHGNFGGIGGTLSMSDSTGLLRNSIIWGNAAGGIARVDATAEATFCDIQGGFAGLGNIDADPLFIAPAGADGVAGTADDDFRVAAGSPVLDGGSNTAAAQTPTDLLGSARIGQCRADMGAIESPVLFLDCDGNGRGDACEIQEAASLDCNVNGKLDRCDIASGLASDCDADGRPDSCEADSDGDGFIDDCDQCPSNASKSVAGPCGCDRANTDADNDGVLDCVDNCTLPNPNQADSDGDGVGDVCDSLRFEGCPGTIEVASTSDSGAVVVFTAPTPVAGFGRVTVQQTHESGQLFPTGMNLVQFVATDEAGGRAACSFSVNVKPALNSPPVEDDCPPLYKLTGDALGVFGFPFGCGGGCLVSISLTLAGLTALRRRRI